MRSTFIVTMSIIIIITILGEVTNSQYDNDNSEAPLGVLGKCPPHLGSLEYYQVGVLRSATPLVSGCAYIQFNQYKRQSFSLWLGNFEDSGLRCHLKNHTDMEHYHFNCLIKPPSSMEDSSKGRMSVRLYGQINAKDTNKAKRIKCAMYDVIKGNATMFRMSISESASCAGLADLLTYPKPTINENNEKYMLLRLSRNKYPKTYEYSNKMLI